MSIHRFCCCGGGGGGNPCQFCSNSSYAAAYAMTGISAYVTYQHGPQAPPTNACNGQDPCHTATSDNYLTSEYIAAGTLNVPAVALYKVPYAGACCYASRDLGVILTLNLSQTFWAQCCTVNGPVVSTTVNESFTTTVPGCMVVSCVTAGATTYLYHRLLVCGGSWNDYLTGLVYPANHCFTTKAQLDAALTLFEAAHPKISMCWRTPLKPLDQLVAADFTPVDWCGCEAGNQAVGCYDPLYPQYPCLGMGCDGPGDADAFFGQDWMRVVLHDVENPPICDVASGLCTYAPAVGRWGCLPGMCTGSGSSDNTTCGTCEYTQNATHPSYA